MEFDSSFPDAASVLFEPFEPKLVIIQLWPRGRSHVPNGDLDLEKAANSCDSRSETRSYRVDLDCRGVPLSDYSRFKSGLNSAQFSCSV